MAVHTSWRMDETYIKVEGEWLFQYPAVDKYGHTIDFFFSKKRDTNAGHRFFNKAIGYHGKPEKITIDKSGANNAALEKINKALPKKDRIEIRKIKYSQSKLFPYDLTMSSIMVAGFANILLFFIMAKSCSIGFKSGEYGGKNKA